MTCKNCYIPNREPPDDLEKFKDFMSRLEVEHLYVSLVQNQLSHLSVQNLFVQFIMKVEQMEETYACTLVTNGLRLSHAKYLDY